MSTNTTGNLALTLPAKSETGWGTVLNTNFEAIDTAVTALQTGGSGGGGTGTIIREREGDLVEEVFMYCRVPADGTISSIVASVLALPSGQSILIDVRKNGTTSTDSVFSADQPITITDSETATNGIYQVAGTLDSSQASCVTGDIISIYVLQVGSDNPGQDLCVQVVF